MSIVDIALSAVLFAFAMLLAAWVFALVAAGIALLVSSQDKPDAKEARRKWLEREWRRDES